MKYAKYGYVWPPRPEQAIPSELIPHFQNEGWVAQVKKNGTCTVVFASPTEVIFKTRHNDDHKAWIPKPEHIQFFKNIAKDGWCVFICELLHSKGGGTKDTLYIFDVIVWQGEYLTRSTFGSRQKFLLEHFVKPRQDETIDHYVLSNGIWLAKLIPGNLLTFWNSLTTIEDEGIVLKNPNAPLSLCNKGSSNSGWQVKCRRPRKNYSF